MATQTYEKLQKQIAALEAQAAKLKSKEVAGVVSRIKEAIAAYSLTPQDLFGSKRSVVNGRAKPKKSVAAKYVDGNGGEWVGRGPRPKWLREALAAGRRLEDFVAEQFKSAVEAVSPTPSSVQAKSATKRAGQRPKPARAAKKVVAAPKFDDGAGNTWSGRGPTPKWLKEAEAAGKSRADFLVKS